jgi:hypothetical protein
MASEDGLPSSVFFLPPRAIPAMIVELKGMDLVISRKGFVATDRLASLKLSH